MVAIGSVGVGWLREKKEIESAGVGSGGYRKCRGRVAKREEGD